MVKLLATTKNGRGIYISEETEEHMTAHDDVNVEDIREAIAHMDYRGGFRIETIDLGRVIGKCQCVEVGKGDDVRLLYRKGRKGRTPIVFNREPEDTTSIVIGIGTDHETGLSRLVTSWYGRVSYREPWDRSIKDIKELKESVRFWNTHALTCVDAVDWERS